MYPKLSLYVKILFSLGTLCVMSVSLSQMIQEGRGFKERLDDFISTHSDEKPAVDTGTALPPLMISPYTDEKKAGLRYLPGDWERYIVRPRQKLVLEGMSGAGYRIEEEDDVELISYGSSKLNLNYGKSVFTKSKYKQYDLDKPVSRVIAGGYNQQNETQLHMEGHVGKRLTLYIDHDSRKKDNQYLMQYRAVRDDEVIREINAGQIDIKMNKSKYAVYDDTSAKGIGIDTTIRKGKLRVKAFGSVTRGETVVESFRGTSSPGNTALREFQYVRNTHYQLEPFKRYDNLSSPPADYRTTVTWTSQPADPANYRPYTVGVDSTGFELYMDDQNPYNNYNAIQLSLDGGYYTRLSSGSDYIINYSTGQVSFLKPVPDTARIFAVYTLNGGSTVSSDAAARTDVTGFTGKLFVFIKYGRSIHEDDNLDGAQDSDKNGDSRFNLDIYEIRSSYYAGSSQILSDNLKLQFYTRNQLMTRDETSRLGKYTVDYTKGLVSFYLREPFKALISAADPGLTTVLYAENQAGNLYERSLYSVRIDYYRDARSFQLKHTNIIQNSVRVKVDNRELSPSLYSIDYTSGFLAFTNPSNPVILPETAIEVKYEYLPLNSQSQSFIGGVRADYDFSRELKLGGTLLFTRSAGGEIIPNIGNEPTQTLVLEGDASLYLNQKRLKDLVSAVPGVKVDSVPFELKGYAEYARSYRKVNTFGKALIDDMESTEEVVGISLFDKDWILSSLPPPVTQNQRGKLYYKYYRDPDGTGGLKGLDFSPYVIDYAVKPGPYNVATGHVADSLQSVETQRSLVFDFDFSGGLDHLAVATRKLSSSSVDLSGLQYVEIIYRADGSAGNVDLFLELGSINEDSDADGVLDTEDANRNGFLDFDPDAGIQEDSGYYFNPAGGSHTWIGAGPKLNSSTRGDGILNTEDLNGNGTLDGNESTVRIPGTISTVPLLTVNMADTGWKVQRIYINRNSSDFTDNSTLLKQVETLRLYLRNGSASTGRIFIDTLRFVSSRWRNIKINDTVNEDPAKFGVTMVNSINDSDYRADAFIYSRRDVYTSLHGERTDKELTREKETALQIEYNLSNESGSVTRKFSKPMDLRFYKTLNLWMNVRAPSVVNTFRFRVGSSESDYMEYEFTKDYENLWREVKFNLYEGKGGGINRISVTGYPDLKRINYMEFIVYNTTVTGSGTIWINDIYTDSADTLTDDAYWYEAEFIGKKPLFRTAAGVPVISDIYIKYVEKGHGSQFSTLGKTSQDIAEKYRQIFSSVNILPNWTARMDIIMEQSRTDSNNLDVTENSRGKTEKKSIYTESDYRSLTPGIPSLKLIYRNDVYENIRQEYLSSGRVNHKTDNRSHSPSIIMNENIENVLGGKLTASLAFDMNFKQEKIERNSPDLSDSVLETLLALNESEKRQKENTRLTLNYQAKSFFIQPVFSISTQEIVELKGKTYLGDTQVLEDVKGGFHFPFFSGENGRFVERNKKTGLRCGFKELWLASPTLQMDLYYFENKFRDYTQSEKVLAGKYSRAKDASSYISNGIAIPLNFHKTASLKFIKNLGFSYTRSVLFQETEIPYEGENRGSMEERYGISRSIDGISDAGLNLFQYPPWYFFLGRGSYANGRDYTYNALNDKLYYPGGGVVSNYTNNLRLIDNYSLNSTMDFEKVVLNLGIGLNQVSERQTVEGVPGQVVTFSNNATLTLDLMRILSFGFFRPNSPGKPFHASTLSLGYDFKRNMLITSNIQEDTHAPSVSIMFKWDRTSLGFKSGMDFRRRCRKEYIPVDDDKRDDRDDIYITNMAAQTPFSEIDRGYRFSTLYETDVQWIYRFFSSYYKLVAFPIFSIEYSLLLNRYDYTQTVSPEPYDQHLLTGKLTLDLHKNVQGGLTARWALERFRNRETEGVSREIMSYEVGLNFTLIF